MHRVFLTLFIMFYVAVSQLHPLMHCDSAPAGFPPAAVVQAACQAGCGAAEQTWRNRMENHCPGDFSNERQAHHSCTCSMLQFTVQPRYENSMLLAVNQLEFPPLDRIDSQYSPSSLIPPPRFS